MYTHCVTDKTAISINLIRLILFELVKYKSIG